MEFLKLLEILRREKRAFLTALGSVVIVTLVLAFLISPVYVSSSKIRLDIKAPQDQLVSSLSSDYSKFQYYDNENIIDTYVTLINSRPCVESVIRRLNLKDSSGTYLSEKKFTNPGITTFVFGSKKGMEVERVEDSEILEVRGFSPDIREAVSIANETVKSFSELYSNVLSKEIQDKRKMLEKEMERVKRELSMAEEQKREFEMENDAVELDKEIELLVTERSDKKSEKRSVELSKEQNLKYMESAMETLENLPEFKINQTTITANPLVNSYKERLYDLNLELSKLLNELTEEHPDIKNLRSQIGKTEALLSKAIERVFSSQVSSRNTYYDTLFENYSNAEIELVTLQAKDTVLSKQIADINSELNDLSSKRIRLNRIDRTIDNLEGLHRSLLTDLSTLKLAESLDVDAINIIEHASVPDKKFLKLYVHFPKKGFLFILSLFLGTLFGLFAAFFLEYIDNTFKTPEEVKEALDVNVLNVVPKDSGKEPCLFIKGMDSKYVDSFYNLKSNIALLSGGKPKVITVTSAQNSEGKTTVVYYLARVLAESGFKTLVIDANLKRPFLHNLFLVQNTTGLGNYLSKENLAFNQTDVPGLDIIPAGSAAEHSLKLIDSPAMQKILNDARAKYDVVILDCPSLESGSEGLVVAKSSEGILLVIGLKDSIRERVKETVAILNKTGTDIVGAIVNKA